MKNISRRGFVAAAAVTAAGAALAGCSGSNNNAAAPAGNEKTAEPFTARLGTTNDGHILNAIAQEQGYLDEENVTVEVSVFSSSDEAFSALFSNKVDILSNNGTNLPLTHIASGQDLTIYAGYMLTGCMPIIAKAGTKWNGVEDLVGKKIACSGNEFAVFGPLFDLGHKMDEFECIVLSNHADRVEAVRGGKADYAICGTSQNYNIGQTKEVEVMCYCSDITPNYSCCRMDSPQKFLDENRDGMVRLLKAYLRAQCWYESNKDEVAKMVVKQTGSTEDFVHAYMDNEHYRLNLDPVENSVVRAWDWMMDMGLFPKDADKIDVNDHIDTSMYKEALDACTAAYGAENKEFYDKMNQFFAENNKA
ncbi:MAG: ABC transporter substrate-binding protein [Coriobacteriia bacterium]|nr:ABC transporter substrate-binding protein [Coriobacteriia bacterium]